MSTYFTEKPSACYVSRDAVALLAGRLGASWVVLLVGAAADADGEEIVWKDPAGVSGAYDLAI
jgi:hypothetical protein